jgi:hypothetical protein
LQGIWDVIKWPLDSFLAYCEHGFRFPQWHENNNSVGLKNINEAAIGESKHCTNIKSTTQNMTHLDANIEFCVGDYKGHLTDENKRISTDFLNIRGSRQICSYMLNFLVDKHSEYPEGLVAKEKWEAFKHKHFWDLGGPDSW